VRGRGQIGLVSIALFATIVICATAFSACGGNSGGPRGGSVARVCQVGEAPSLHVRRVPPWVVRKGLGSPPHVLSCFGSPFHGAAELVGFRNVGPSVCLTVDNLRRREPHGEICTDISATPVEQWCGGGLGCITGFAHPPGLTEFSGPVDPVVKTVHLDLDGRAAKADIYLTPVTGSLARSIDEPKSFGFFVAFLAGCVPSDEVRVTLAGAAGESLGTAGSWQPPLGCGKA
jgi:hypothetical protein